SERLLVVRKRVRDLKSSIQIHFRQLITRTLDSPTGGKVQIFYRLRPSLGVYRMHAEIVEISIVSLRRLFREDTQDLPMIFTALRGEHGIVCHVHGQGMLKAELRVRVLASFVQQLLGLELDKPRLNFGLRGIHKLGYDMQRHFKSDNGTSLHQSSLLLWQSRQ